MLPLELHVPLAGEIQEHNSGNPHEIDKRQAVAIAVWDGLKNKIPMAKPGVPPFRGLVGKLIVGEDGPPEQCQIA